MAGEILDYLKVDVSKEVKKLLQLIANEHNIVITEIKADWFWVYNGKGQSEQVGLKSVTMEATI